MKKQNDQGNAKAILLSGLATVIILLLLTSSHLILSRRDSLDRGATELSNHVFILAEAVLQATRAGEAVLRETVEDIGRRNPETQSDYNRAFSDEETFKRLEARSQSLPWIDVVTIVNVDGDVVNFSRSFPAPRINLADRDYFVGHRDEDGLARQISAPVQNRGTGTWVFYQSRPIYRDKSEFFGLVLVGLSQSYFNMLFERSNTDIESKFALFRVDGTYIAGDETVRVLASLDRWLTMEEGARIADNQQKDTSVAVERNGMFVSYRLIEGTPLVLVSTKSKEAILKNWNFQAVTSAVVVVLFASVLLWAIFGHSEALRDQEKLIRDLREAKLAAQNASRSKSSFLANMSHELRTPLNAIIGFSDIISAERFGRIESRKYVEYATDIRSAGDHLLELINEILDFSKIENGNTVLDEQAIDVCGLVERCMRLIKPQAEAKHIRLVASGIEEIIALKCDELRMRQVLINILSNAVKFTPSQGSVSVRVFSSGKHFCIEVRDTGIGMTRDEIKAAIQPFVQIHSTTFQKTEGTGLGLPIAKKLVELHGGDLKISSRPGSGTILTIEMPPWRLET